MSKKIHPAWFIFVGSLLFSFFGFGLVVNTPGLYFPSLTNELTISQTAAALTITVQQVCSALTLFVAGRIIDRVPARILMTICAILFGGGFILCAHLSNIYLFYLVWGLIGVAQAFCLTLGISVYLGNWFEQKYGMVMGISLGVSAIGGAVFNPIISSIITNYGWRAAYFISGATMLIVLVPIALFLYQTKPTGRQKPYGYREDAALAERVAAIQTMEHTEKPLAGQQHLFYYFLIPMILLNFVNGYVQHVSSHILTKGLSLNFGGTIISAIMIGASLGKIMIGSFLDKFDYVKVIFVFSLFSTMGWLGLTYVNNDIILLGCSFVLGLGQGIVLVALPFLVRKTYGGKIYSKVFSLLSMFGAFGQALSVSLAGVLYDMTGNYIIQFTSASIFFVISYLCFFLLKQQEKNAVSID